MASTYTTNTHLELQATGENSGTWGSLLNANDFTILDNVLGNVQTISLSGTNVTLTTTQSQVNWIKLTGALVADVSVIFPAIGRTYLVSNSTTGGHVVTLKIGTSTGTVIPQGVTQVIGLDGSDVSSLGYLSLTGGQINGNLGIAATADNTFANGKAIAIGDDDTGIRQNGDGVLEVWTNNTLRTTFGPTGNLNVNSGTLQEGGQRVYSPNNPPPKFGANQSWQLPSRSDGLVYQNTTGNTIQVNVSVQAFAEITSLLVGSTSPPTIVAGQASNSSGVHATLSALVPNSQYYLLLLNDPHAFVTEWAELR